jgi:hypothetical protein
LQTLTSLLPEGIGAGAALLLVAASFGKGLEGLL